MWGTDKGQGTMTLGVSTSEERAASSGNSRDKRVSFRSVGLQSSNRRYLTALKTWRFCSGGQSVDNPENADLYLATVGSLINGRIRPGLFHRYATGDMRDKRDISPLRAPFVWPVHQHMAPQSNPFLQSLRLYLSVSVSGDGHRRKESMLCEYRDENISY